MYLSETEWTVAARMAGRFLGILIWIYIGRAIFRAIKKRNDAKR